MDVVLNMRSVSFTGFRESKRKNYTSYNGKNLIYIYRRHYHGNFDNLIDLQSWSHSADRLLYGRDSICLQCTEEPDWKIIRKGD